MKEALSGMVINMFGDVGTVESNSRRRHEQRRKSALNEDKNCERLGFAEHTGVLI